MVKKRVDVWLKMLALEQLLNSSPALGLCYGANRGASYAGLMESLKGGGELPTRMQGKSDPPVLTCMNKGNRCRL